MITEHACSDPSPAYWHINDFGYLLLKELVMGYPPPRSFPKKKAHIGTDPHCKHPQNQNQKKYKVPYSKTSPDYRSTKQWCMVTSENINGQSIHSQITLRIVPVITSSNRSRLHVILLFTRIILRGFLGVLSGRCTETAEVSTGGWGKASGLLQVAARRSFSDLASAS
jgi:hypothetical protein